MNRIFLVWRKEISDMIRDRRVLNGAIIMPVFTIVLFMLLIGSVSSRLKNDPSLPMAVVSKKDSLVSQQLEGRNAKLRLVETEAEGLALLRKGDVKLVIVYPDDLLAGALTGQTTIKALFSEGDTMSLMAMSALRSSIEKINNDQLRASLEAQGLSAGVAERIKLEQVNTDKGQGFGGSSLVSLLPYMIVLWAFYGGMSIVADLVAGEKEKGTLETLLISPIRRIELAWGKILALATICLASAMTNVIAILGLGLVGLPATKELFPEGIQIGLPAAAAFFLLLLPLVAFFAGMMISISAFARSMRECQTYLTLASFLVLMPAIFSQFANLTGVDRAMWVLWTPVLNTSLAMRAALGGGVDWTNVGISAFTTGVLATVFLLLATWLFRREEIVNRS